MPGKLNIAADMLTRYPRDSEIRKERRRCLNNIRAPTYSKDLNKKIKTMAEEQAKDERIRKLLHKNTTFMFFFIY